MAERAPSWLVIGGVVIAFGSFLPWLEVTTWDTSIGHSGLGFGARGVITLGIGVVLAIMGRLLIHGQILTTVVKVILWLSLAVFVFVWVAVFNDIGGAIKLANGDLGTDGSVGVGMWAMAIGGVFAIVGVMNLPGISPVRSKVLPEDEG